MIHVSKITKQCLFFTPFSNKEQLFLLVEYSKMEQFQIKQPSELLRPYVNQYWFLAIDNAERSSL